MHTKNTPNCTCERCGKAFFRHPCEMRERNYCSSACFHESRATKPEDMWDRVDTSHGPDSCWEWQGRTNFGYGIVMIRGRNVRAHRLAFELTNGPIPDGLMVRHKCDNRRCVNPAHLELGTHQDNMNDMIERGRKPCGDRHHTRLRPETVARGERQGNSKLSTSDVVRILELTRGEHNVSEIARMFGVQRAAIRRIRDGKGWTHVKPRSTASSE